MELDAFQRMVGQVATDIPAEYLDGVGAIDVSPRVVAHPTSPDVFTLGECVPVHGDGNTITSRIVLYYGSFRALALVREGFDWREEAWETLTHELRHHLEWRANAGALEAYDWAVDHNFSRQEGRPFDPLFYRSGEPLADGAWKVEDDVFLERTVRRPPGTVTFTWRGRNLTVALEGERNLPLFVVVGNVPDPPVGDLVLVIRRRARVSDLFRKAKVREVHRRAVAGHAE